MLRGSPKLGFIVNMFLSHSNEELKKIATELKIAPAAAASGSTPQPPKTGITTTTPNIPMPVAEVEEEKEGEDGDGDNGGEVPAPQAGEAVVHSRVENMESEFMGIDKAIHGTRSMAPFMIQFETDVLASKAEREDAANWAAQFSWVKKAGDWNDPKTEVQKMVAENERLRYSGGLFTPNVPRKPITKKNWGTNITNPLQVYWRESVINNQQWMPNRIDYEPGKPVVYSRVKPMSIQDKHRATAKSMSLFHPNKVFTSKGIMVV